MASDRANLRSRARIRADQDSSNFPTDAQYNLILDECGKTIFYDLIQAGWPVTPTSQTIVANGASAYTLNSGDPLHSITEVYANVNGTVYPVPRADEQRMADYRSVTAAGQPFAAAYRPFVDMALGPRIEFLPTPPSGSYQVFYINEWPGFTNDADVWRGPARSDELIVLMAAAKACRKEGEVRDAEALEDEYGKLFVRVMNAASGFDARNVPKVRDVEGDLRRDAFDYLVDRRY